MVANDIKISLKRKNKGWLFKNIYIFEKVEKCCIVIWSDILKVVG